MYPPGSVTPVSSASRVHKQTNTFSEKPAIASQSRVFYLNTNHQQLSEKGNKDEDEK
jgi:hypothetical protein